MRHYLNTINSFAIFIMISFKDPKEMSYPGWVSCIAFGQILNCYSHQPNQISQIIQVLKTSGSLWGSREGIRWEETEQWTAHIDMKIEREANVEEIQIEVWVRQIQEQTNRISPSEICQTCLLLTTWHILLLQCNHRWDQTKRILSLLWSKTLYRRGKSVI